MICRWIEGDWGDKSRKLSAFSVLRRGGDAGIDLRNEDGYKKCETDWWHVFSAMVEKITGIRFKEFVPSQIFFLFVCFYYIQSFFFFDSYAFFS